jgi:RNA polymerase sigma-70 factor (ECF subfamily)
MLKEIDVIRGCADGKREHQKTIYKQFYPTVFKVCMGYSKTQQEGEDYIQETFMKLFTKIDTFRGDSYAELGGWLKMIAKNHCIDEGRKKKMNMDDDEDVFTFIPEEEEEPMELPYSSELVFKAIQSLSPKYNMIFNLYVMDGYTHREIGEILDIHEGTSKANLWKAKRNLRKFLLENS